MQTITAPLNTHLISKIDKNAIENGQDLIPVGRPRPISFLQSKQQQLISLRNG